PAQLGLLHDPGRKRGDLAQELRLLLRGEAEPLAQQLELVVEHIVGESLEAGHGQSPLSKMLLARGTIARGQSSSAVSEANHLLSRLRERSARAARRVREVEDRSAPDVRNEIAGPSPSRSARRLSRKRERKWFAFAHRGQLD